MKVLNRHGLFFILTLVVVALLDGCRTGKSSAVSHAISQADSIKYKAVRQAFLDGEFVFKVSRKYGWCNVNPIDNFFRIHNGRIGYQRLTGNGGGIGAPSPKYEEGKLFRVKYSVDQKKGEISMAGFSDVLRSDITIHLFENSDRAYGYLDQIPFEGTIEPLQSANIALGQIYKNY